MDWKQDEQYQLFVNLRFHRQRRVPGWTGREVGIDQRREPCNLETSRWVTEVSELMKGSGKWLQVFVISTLVIVSGCRRLIQLMRQVVPWHYPLPHGRLLMPGIDGGDGRVPWERDDRGGLGGSRWWGMGPGCQPCSPTTSLRDRTPPNLWGIEADRPTVWSRGFLWRCRCFVGSDLRWSGGGNSCSVDGGRRGLVKGLSRETWKVGEIQVLIM